MREMIDLDKHNYAHYKHHDKTKAGKIDHGLYVFGHRQRMAGERSDARNLAKIRKAAPAAQPDAPPDPRGRPGMMRGDHPWWLPQPAPEHGPITHGEYRRLVGPERPLQVEPVQRVAAPKPKKPAKPKGVKGIVNKIGTVTSGLLRKLHKKK